MDDIVLEYGEFTDRSYEILMEFVDRCDLEQAEYVSDVVLRYVY